MLLDTLFLFLSFIALSLCDEHIDSVNKFISFSNAVNSGKGYSGTTVFLDADIDFSSGYSEQFNQIGNYSDIYGTKKPFDGVFDGQGHTISNLVMNSPLESVGLFGYSTGATIKNIVIDSSCSFTSSIFSSNDRCYPYVGSVLGICFSLTKSCVIENNVNMASVTFEGTVSANLFFGGIAGAVTLNKFSSYIKNCVNYGSVTHIGTCFFVSEMGGIVGIGDKLTSESVYNYIQNCANYGTITHDGVSEIPAVGGIAGNSLYSYFDNCVNSGKIIINQKSEYIGAILGDITEKTSITHCYWTSVVSNYNVYGFNEDIVTDKDNSLVSLNKETLDELNKYATKDSTWSKWVTLHLNGGKINNLDYDELTIVQDVLPNPKKEDCSFLFWCKDAETTTQYNPKTDTDISELYAGWSIGTVAFDFGNGTVINETLRFNAPIELPKGIIEREGYTFNGWDINPEFTPGKDITITAQWIPNNYTVTFDFDNGTVINETFIFNTIIELPKGIIEREGYTFNGWNNKTSLIPAENITIMAQWIINNYTVTFDFDNGTVVNETFAFNTIIELPKGIIEREGYTFNGWNNKTSLMPAENITITAQWIINNYTVTFDFDNGTTINETFIFNTPIELPKGIIEREGYTFNGWNNKTSLMPAENTTIMAQWVINNYTVTFDFDNGTVVNETFSYNDPIEYPTIASKDGYKITWDNEIEFMPSNDITITAVWILNNYTVTFDFDNGTVVNETFAFNALIEYPDVKMNGYTFNGWINNVTLMPAKNITVTAQWTPNKYVVSFNVNGGDNLDINEQYVLFGSPYGKLPTPTRANYTFIGWFNDRNENVASGTTVSIADNHVLTAQWKQTPTRYVQIVFDTQGLSKEEIDTIVGRYSKSDYTIMKIEDSETGETVAIVKFNDPETAENFVDTVIASGGISGTVSFISEFVESLSLDYYPLTLLSLFIL